MIAKQSKCSVHKTKVGNLLITQEINGRMNDLREESFFLWPHCCEWYLHEPGPPSVVNTGDILLVSTNQFIPAWRAAANCWNSSLEDEGRATPFMLYSLVMDPVGLFQ